MKNKVTKVLLMVIVTVAIAGCSKNDDDMSFQQPDQELFDIPTTLENLSNQAVAEKDGEEVKDAKGFYFRNPRPTYWTLLTALAKTDLLGTVVRNKLTLFAPTDKAFAELGLNPRNIGSLPNLKEILLYHVIEGRVYSFKLKSEFVPTLNGAAVEIKVGDKITVNDAEVVYANIWALNGVIHVIDKVLLPPDKNLVDLALSFDPEFSILVDAVITAGLAETLATGGPFTVFAPTNQAFVDLLGELGFTSLDDLVNNPVKGIGIEGLTNVLLYHVVSGRVYSSDLVSGPVTTLNGTFSVNVSDLTITDANDRDSNLVPALLNVQATNGVIHVIDRVILP